VNGAFELSASLKREGQSLPNRSVHDWFREGRAWNEVYLIRAFLQNNPDYKILLFGSFVAQRLQPLLEQYMPLCLKNTGGALWLLKVR
jgi:hypothetical protein